MTWMPGRRWAWRFGRKLYCLARGDGVNRPENNGEYWLLDELVTVLPDQAVLLDVGANKGDWSLRVLAVARRAGKSVSLKAFEPCTGTRRVLAARLSGAPEVELFGYAVSSADGEADFFSSGDGAGTNSLHPVSGALAERVTLITLESFVARHNLAVIHMLKVDTEGGDFGVLLGARRLLAEGRIDVIQFEYNWRWLLNKTSLLDVFALVRDAPYRVGKLVGTGVEFYADWHPELDRFFENNYVLVRIGGPLEHLGPVVVFDDANCPRTRADGPPV